MARVIAIIGTILLLLTARFSLAQTSAASDLQALSLAAKSIAAMTGKTAVSDVTLNANVISIAGSDYFTGTAMLRAKGIDESRVDLKLNDTTRTEIRTTSNGLPTGAWIKATAAPQSYAVHNCWTDAVWFLPALSSLTQTLNPNFVFSYIGQQQHGGVSTQHIRMYRVFPEDSKNVMRVRELSSTDFYLDPVSSVPLAMVFTVHPDDDINADLSMEIRFASYQSVNGTQVPFHIQRLLNGGVVLDLTVTNAILNSGVSDIPFSVQ